MRTLSTRCMLKSAVTAATLVALAGFGTAAQADRKSCDRDFKPQVGQAGKDVVWVPTPDELVQKMLSMARVTPQDLVYDLGAGDGKITIAAAKLGATAIGIEYNPQMAKLADCYAKADGMGERVRIINGDIFKEDFSKATVVTMYLLPELNIRLRPTILDMRPGTRVTSHQFTMGDWEADETAQFDFRTAYLWIVPAKVQGVWSLREQGGGNANYTVSFTQTYQKVAGDVAWGSNKNMLAGTLRGEDIAFAFTDERGLTRTVFGKVQGNQLTGTVKGPDGNELRISGSRR
jgi:SAM-dependent methyltransferase